MSSKSDLKQLFETGDVITQSSMYNLIDSYVNTDAFTNTDNQLVAQEFIEAADPSVTGGLVKVRKNLINVNDGTEEQQSLTFSSSDDTLSGIISQIDSENYQLDLTAGTAITNKITNPALPVLDGTYILKVTIASGVPTYSWETA